MEYEGYEPVIGTPLVELFSIRINSEADKCDVYGSIKVTEDCGILYLYNRTLENAESIHRNDSLSLICPFRPISAAAPFTIDFDLKWKNGDNPEFIKESFTWDGTSNELYDKCSVVNVKGKNGSATVYITIFKAGLLAFVKAELIEAGQTTDWAIYGRLIAHFDSRFDHSGGQNLEKHSHIVLFEVEEPTEHSKPMMQKIGEITLSRPRIAVPAYASLIIEANLSYRHSSNVVEHFVKHEMEFPVYETFHCGHVEEIKGEYGGIIRIEVGTTHIYFPPKWMGDLECEE